MDNIFFEEQKNLAEVELQIDTAATRYEEKAAEIYEELTDFFCIDNDDRDKRFLLRREHEKISEKAKEYRIRQNEPYFGRLDLDQDDGESFSTHTYFIGKKGISDGTNVIVVDWQAPIAEGYYSHTRKDFVVDDVRYYLSLRRALDIKNGELIRYNTEYDGESVSLNGEVIDPFLLEVLRDKRRHYKLTDIIQTIQENQNEIIRKPFDTSFIVQGCAGSGKTMILLHRLSYLLFNYKDRSFSGVKIITPNKYFDFYINDLSMELGLSAIERFTVEEYYVSLMKKYSAHLSVEAEVESEKGLSPELLTIIYSEEYQNEFVRRYHEYWRRILQLLDEKRIKSIFNEHGIEYPDTSKNRVDVVTGLERGLRRILKKYDESAARKSEIKEHVAFLERQIEADSLRYEREKDALAQVKDQTLLRLKLELNELEKNILSKEQQLKECRLLIEQNNLQAESVLTDLNEAESLQEIFETNLERYSDYDSFISGSDVVSQMISESCSDILHSISALKENLKKTPFLNMVKKRELRRRIAERKNDFSERVHSVFLSVKKNTELLRNNMDHFRSTTEIAEQNIIDAKEFIRRSVQRRDALDDSIDVFTAFPAPDTMNDLSNESRVACIDILVYYEDKVNSLQNFLLRIDALRKRKDEDQYILKEMEIAAETEEVRTFIENSLEIVEKLHINEASRNILTRDLLVQYKRCGQKYEKVNYRHKLFLKLLFCSLYYMPLANPDSFLNIDEAQDISVSEYKLLLSILGKQCIFNLYGDVHQSLYDCKGIENWDDIKDLSRGNIEILNENYRNSLQITHFCNDEFSLSLYPIGISGEPVSELDPENAIKKILAIKREYPEYRIAIIHRYGLKSVESCLRELLADEDVSWYEINDKKLSILSVDDAKGLEFEVVLVFATRMTENEKYVSFTRALDQLIVVRDL